MMKFIKSFTWRHWSLIVYTILLPLSIYFALQLRFTFDFRQFFPKGDADLVFFQSFIKEFESDDNFLLVGIRRKEGVFEQKFLQQFQEFTINTRDLPYVTASQSLTKLSFPLKTPFGISAIPVIHIDEPNRYVDDKARILKDKRFVHNLISEDATTMVVYLKTKESLNLQESEKLINALNVLIAKYPFQEYHYLGPSYFQKEFVAMEKREVAVSTGISAVLVAIIMALIFRKRWSVLIALASIASGMIFFFGLLGFWGRELSAMAALYPVLMVIIGTSDIIHILSKYIDELEHGHTRDEAIWITVKEIGFATFMTAVTTAVGFATLVTSRISPIQDFGINASIGVMVAYFSVLLFATAALSMFEKNDLIKKTKELSIWDKLMEWVYAATKKYSREIALFAFIVLIISIWGITKIKTNFAVEDNMPLGAKITKDFQFFEKQFAGFRPLEFAVFAQGDLKANDYEVVKEMDNLESYLETIPSIKSITSSTMLYKSLHQMYHGNNPDSYVMPESAKDFDDYQRLVRKMPPLTTNVLISKDERKARISTRILDLGADSVMAVGDNIERWISANTDSTVAKFKRTGTGYILDKNAMYVRDDLVEGLFLEIVLIAFLMALMLKNVRMILIFLIPNLFPLFFAGALLGFLGVDLDAGISMVFTVVFGIAIDDTIHFLSSFRLNRNKTNNVEKAIYTTLKETGKPVCITTIILFFAFLVMLFSVHPPSKTIGLLIAITLIGALMSDLFINPILLRWWIKDDKKE